MSEESIRWFARSKQNHFKITKFVKFSFYNFPEICLKFVVLLCGLTQDTTETEFYKFCAKRKGIGTGPNERPAPHGARCMAKEISVFMVHSRDII